MKEYPISIRYLVRLTLVSAVVAILIITKQLLVPVSFSVFLAYLLYPSARRLEAIKIPRIATNFIVIFSFMAIIFGVLYVIRSLIGEFSDDLPQLSSQFAQTFKDFQQLIQETVGLSVAQQNEIIRSRGLNGDYFGMILEIGTNLFITLALIPVYTFLLLFYRDKFYQFLMMLVKPKNESVLQIIINKASNVVPKYLTGLFVVCSSLVVLNSLGFTIIGVEYPILFGLIAAIFNLIPYLGTIIGYGIVCVFVLGVQSPAVAGAVVIQFFIVQFLENNILTPNITGSYVRINPLVIIFSLIAGGLVWGLPGMFLVIPTLGILKIVFESVEEWKPYAFFIGTSGTESHSITIKAVRKRFGWEDDQSGQEG